MLPSPPLEPIDAPCPSAHSLIAPNNAKNAIPEVRAPLLRDGRPLQLNILAASSQHLSSKASRLLHDSSRAVITQVSDSREQQKSIITGTKLDLPQDTVIATVEVNSGRPMRSIFTCGYDSWQISDIPHLPKQLSWVMSSLSLDLQVG